MILETSKRLRWITVESVQACPTSLVLLMGNKAKASILPELGIEPSTCALHMSQGEIQF